jgi:hypothetical protein
MRWSVADSKHVVWDHFEETGIEGVLIDKDGCSVAFVEGDKMAFVRNEAGHWKGIERALERMDKLMNSEEYKASEEKLEQDKTRQLQGRIYTLFSESLETCLDEVDALIEKFVCGLPCKGQIEKCHTSGSSCSESSQDVQR